jgi:hypothetical protein
VVILLDIINDGLRLQLTGYTKAGEIVFGLIIGLVGVSLLLLIAVVEVRRLLGTGGTSGVVKMHPGGEWCHTSVGPLSRSTTT